MSASLGREREAGEADEEEEAEDDSGAESLQPARRRAVRGRRIASDLIGIAL